MTHVSKPLVGLLVATVAFFALWVVALKPSGQGGSSGPGASKGLGQFQSDINAAHQAVNTSNADNSRAGADPTSAAPTAGTAPAAAHAAKAPAVTVKPVARTAAKAKAVSRSAAKPAGGAHAAATRLSAVQRALHAHKVLALLFYNPAAPDDRAVRQELGTVPAHGGKVFKLTIPLNEIVSYLAITNQVPVNVAPTLVLVAPNGQVDEIVGYTDPFEISQRVDDALALR
jgi:hypothetical protein